MFEFWKNFNLFELYISSKNWNKVRNVESLAENFNIFKKFQNTHILYDVKTIHQYCCNTFSSWIPESNKLIHNWRETLKWSLYSWVDNNSHIVSMDWDGWLLKWEIWVGPNMWWWCCKCWIGDDDCKEDQSSIWRCNKWCSSH